MIWFSEREVEVHGIRSGVRRGVAEEVSIGVVAFLDANFSSESTSYTWSDNAGMSVGAIETSSHNSMWNRILICDIWISRVRVGNDNVSGIGHYSWHISSHH